MSFWVQHGYGKGQKLDDLLMRGSLGGVVLSPADEEASTLSATAQSLAERDTLFTLDPQTYVWSIPDGTARNHESNGLQFHRLHWSMPASEIEAVVTAVVATNARLGSRIIVSPSCLQRGFSDVWTPLAVQFARATLEAAPGERVYVSVVVDETALSDWGAVDDWLDIATLLEARGFYLVIARSGQTYPQPWEPSRFANLLRLIYRLSALNEYEVLLGYSDLDGLAAIAAGAAGVASGWYFSLRAFAEAKWQPSAGGRPPRPRVLSPSLLSPLIAESEGSLVARSSLGTTAFPDEGTRGSLVGQQVQWSLSESWLQHMDTLRSLVSSLESTTGVAARVTHLDAQLADAQVVLRDIEGLGVVLAPTYAATLGSMRTALSEFSRLEGIS
jgi:hypothetical protein